MSTHRGLPFHDYVAAECIAYLGPFRRPADLGFSITDEKPELLSLQGEHIALFIERGPALGPVLKLTINNVEEAKRRLLKNACEIIKDEPNFPRCYIKDRLG